MLLHEASKSYFVTVTDGILYNSVALLRYCNGSKLVRYLRSLKETIIIPLLQPNFLAKTDEKSLNGNE